MVCATQPATQNEPRVFAIKETVKFQQHNPYFCVLVKRRSKNTLLQEGVICLDHLQTLTQLPNMEILPIFDFFSRNCHAQG